MPPRRFVAYYRVSTVRQGRSGLGLEAQKVAVLAYLNGGSWDLIGEFTEIESGKRNDRTQLAAALAACRLRRATLVIAKLDRLARNVAFVSALLESGVEFVAADFPQANRLTIHILAAVAEHEARAISDRTKAALAAAKARGTVLGGFRGHIATEDARARSLASRKAAADNRASDLRSAIQAIEEEGATSLRQIAEGLNARAICAPRGGAWSPSQVRSLKLRLEGPTKTEGLH
ncbi:DNA invertase Pin-like site-specific DNA recombinase [Enterovirga rhinocerotis]|uniref:DNA invertase Pin-like site-specific DNA recombinase n=2 Tax=Enterovirga rhinocerotis TaxID=1339210 RepID=A0A4R7CEX7_9HYPH|nr:recombinase family protein [Enterovirga rhinocerotis]TDR95471.1 DNA invertase Pin-like site-specific DNA recombinase [Enterovirga rhinocerotis]